MIKLESLVADQPVEILTLTEGTVTVGRDADNGIVVDSDSVSRRHCCFFEALGYWFYRDFNSTNGSWINGVKVTADQLRLLRDGDFIQVANFPLRVTEYRDDGVQDPAMVPPSLIVFSGDNVEADVPLAIPGAKFVIGGPEGHFYLDGFPEGEVLLEIVYAAPRIELITGGPHVPAMVNGMHVGGVTELVDRDEVDISGLKIIVSDLASAESSKEARMRAAMASHERTKSTVEKSPIVARQGSRPPIANDWETDAMRRKEMGRKFIFGSPPADEHNVTGTMAMPISQMGGVGFETSSSFRFTQGGGSDEPEGRPGLSEGVHAAIGFFVFLGIVGALVYFFNYV